MWEPTKAIASFFVAFFVRVIYATFFTHFCDFGFGVNELFEWPEDTLQSSTEMLATQNCPGKWRGSYAEYSSMGTHSIQSGSFC